MKQPEPEHRKHTRTARIIGSSRYLMALAVLGTFLAASVLLILGVVDMFSAVWEAITGGAEENGTQAIQSELIEAVDVILVSSVLYVIAIGLYQLFVDMSVKIPRWLRTEDISDLEQRLSGMVITILGVIFLTRVLQWNGEEDLLVIGLATASVIAAVSLFLYQEAKHRRHDDSSRDE